MTIQEAYKKITESEKLRNKYIAVKDTQSLEAFLKEVGCIEAPEKFIEYVRGKYEGEIPDAEMESVVGGIGGKRPPLPPINW